MANKIYLGITINNEPCYLEKHSWACGWYWGFGYLGNRNLHYHFESYLDGKHWKVEKVFKETKLTQENWWIIHELFKQAYILKECAALYQYNGHITNATNLVDIRNLNLTKKLNADLEKVLDAVWDYLVLTLQDK